MVEESIEYDADAFPTIDEAKCVESDDEEERSGTIQPGCENRQDGEEQRGEDLEWEFGECVLEEEGFDGVGVVVVFAVEDCFFVGVDGDVLEHADEVEGSVFLDVAKAGLDAVEVAFQGGEEEG